MGYRGMYLLMAVFSLLFCLLYLIVDKKMKEQRDSREEISWMPGETN